MESVSSCIVPQGRHSFSCVCSRGYSFTDHACAVPHASSRLQFSLPFARSWNRPGSGQPGGVFPLIRISQRSHRMAHRICCCRCALGNLRYTPLPSPSLEFLPRRRLASALYGRHRPDNDLLPAALSLRRLDPVASRCADNLHLEELPNQL